MSKQIRDTPWQCESMWAWRKWRWGASIKKMHIDSERSSLNTVKDKWTKRELFLKPDHKHQELKSRIFSSEECTGISKRQKRKTIPLKDRQQERGVCRDTSLQALHLHCLPGPMEVMLFLWFCGVRWWIERILSNTGCSEWLQISSSYINLHNKLK